MPPRKTLTPTSAAERMSEKRTPEKVSGNGSTGKKNAPPRKKRTAADDGASIQETVIISGGSGVDRSAVERRAWEIWQNEGCPDGREVEHWLQAERELGLNS